MQIILGCRSWQVKMSKRRCQEVVRAWLICCQEQKLRLCSLATSTKVSTSKWQRLPWHQAACAHDPI